MPRVRVFGLCLAILTAMTLVLAGAGPAQAGGSLTLADILKEFNGQPKFIAEVKAELKKQKLKAQKVSCYGSRFGNHWTYLVGGRSVPYECQVGSRTLSVDGELVFYDKKGKELDFFGEGTPEHAVRFKTANLTWIWDKPDEVP